MNLINEQSVATSTCTSIKELSASAQVRRGAKSSSSLSLSLSSLSSSSSSSLESESESVGFNVTSKTETKAKTTEYIASPASSFSFGSSSSFSLPSTSTLESAALTFSTLVRSSPATASPAVESINRQIEKKISNKIILSDAADQINLISKMPSTTTTTTINDIVKPPPSTSSSASSTAATSSSSAAGKSLAKMTVHATTTTTTTPTSLATKIENVNCSDVSDCIKSNKNCDNMTLTTTTTKPPEKERKIGCEHYKRRAMFVTPCCNKFYKCRYCHDEKETHHFDRKTLTELICVECNTRQKVQEQCEKCGVRFGKYTCLICNLFDDEDKNQYHCHGCGICRIGGRDNFFHCETCNMCLPIELKIEGHRCVENISRSNCPVCLGAIHTSRIPCHIPDCGHLLHKMCFDQLLASGHYVCPTCQTSLLDMTKMWEYLDTQALLMTMPKKYENQRVYIFCNDCHDTCKTKFHFVGLKCIHCGGYNTTQDIKRRMSWANVDSSTSA